jgi:hypothetical protein
MGMNVAFRYKGQGPFKPFPEEYQDDWKGCLPRYSDSWKFMEQIYDGEIISLKNCSCGDKHQYMCEGETAHRPLDFIALKERTKHLQPVWQEVIDYMESEPAAYVEYS